MPSLPPVTIPADAMDKANEKVKTVDYYADLTDEERAEEDLPPRETPKADAPPDDKPVVAKPAAAVDDEEPEGDDALEGLFASIADLKETIDDRLGKPTPAKTEKEVDARLKAALESDDEETRYFAEQLQATNERIERIETAAQAERIARQTAKDDADFDAVQDSYLIGGKPMTDDQVDQVGKFIEANPEVGARLSIAQLTRVVFPDAVKAPKSPPAKGPGDAKPVNGDGHPVATIVDAGATGGGGPTRFTPRANETIDSAVSQFAKDVGWKRG